MQVTSSHCQTSKAIIPNGQSIIKAPTQQRILPEIYVITEAQRMDDQFITAHEHGRVKDDENCERSNRILGSAVQEHEVNSLFWQICKVS